MMGYKKGGNNVTLLIIIGVGLLAVLFLKPLSDFFKSVLEVPGKIADGFDKMVGYSDQEKREKENQDAKTKVGTVENPNPFDPNLWKKVQQAGKNANLIKEVEAKAKAKKLYDSIDMWSGADFDSIFAIFKSLTTQTQVSYMCYKFSQYYGKDLLQYLDGKKYQLGTLSANNTKKIIDYCNGLPLYR